MKAPVIAPIGVAAGAFLLKTGLREDENMNTAFRIMVIMAVAVGGAWFSERQKHSFISYCIGALSACLMITLGVMP